MKFRKKDIPKYIEIADGIFYSVLWKRNMGGRYMGLCWYDAKEIWIKLGMSEKDTIETLQHEILHAQSYEWGFDLRHPTIEKLEEPQAFFLLRNCGWIKWSS